MVWSRTIRRNEQKSAHELERVGFPRVSASAIIRWRNLCEIQPGNYRSGGMVRLSIAGAGGPVPQLRLLEIKKATEEKDRSLTTLYLVVGSYPIPVRENTDSGFLPVSRPLLTDPFEWRSLPQGHRRPHQDDRANHKDRLVEHSQLEGGRINLYRSHGAIVLNITVKYNRRTSMSGPHKPVRKKRRTS